MCAILAKRCGITDRDQIKKMSWRYVNNVLLRRANEDGGIDPTGIPPANTVQQFERDTDWLALKRGIPREYWKQYAEVMAQRSAEAFAVQNQQAKDKQAAAASRHKAQVKTLLAKKKS